MHWGGTLLLRMDPEDQRHHQRRWPSRRGAGRRPRTADVDTRDARPPHVGHRPVRQGPHKPLHDPRSRGH